MDLAAGLTALSSVFTWITTNFEIVFTIFVAGLALAVVTRVARRLAGR